MKPNVDTSLSRQHAKLAARPKCGFLWETSKPAGLAWLELKLHACVKLKNHAGMNHRCACGTWNKRKRA